MAVGFYCILGVDLVKEKGFNSNLRRFFIINTTRSTRSKEVRFGPLSLKPHTGAYCLSSPGYFFHDFSASQNCKGKFNTSSPDHVLPSLANFNLCQVLLLGDASVGKTSLRSQFIYGQFTGAYHATVSSDFLSTRVVTTSGVPVSLMVWDTAGQERFKSLGQTFYRGTDVLVLVYDLTNAASFLSLAQWLAEFRAAERGTRRASVVLVGNKVDRAEYRAVSTRQAVEFAAAEWGAEVASSASNVVAGTVAEQVEATCFEVSAKDKTDVQKLFTTVADIAVRRDERQLLGFDEMDECVDIEQPEPSYLSKCC